MLHKVDIPHHLDDYECMWNGVEDLYILKTGEKLPPKFFFTLCSGSFCYMKMPKAEQKRLVALGDGRTRKMYEFLAPIVGFDYKFHECSSFENARKRVKKEIDSGYPVMLGALDMYYLSYLKKLYHGEHIPFHYVLMTGYDDENQFITLLDCGRQEEQHLSYDDLSLAWNCSYPGLSKPFTYCTIRMNHPNAKEDIVRETLHLRGDMFLHPKVGFVGYKGFEKFISELPKWKDELGKVDYDKQLYNMVQFYGTVPTIPNKLKGIDKPDELPFYGGFDKMSDVLLKVGKEYHNAKWTSAGLCFGSGAKEIEKIKEIIVDYLTEEEDRTEELPLFYTKIKDIMIEGYSILEG